MNVGIIGFGKQGRIRLETIKNLNNGFNVIRINDIAVPSNYNLGGIKFTDKWTDITDDKQIDIVFVCTPNHLTKEIVIRALNNGKHVFSEKPPGRNLQETESMRESELKSKKKLMFGFNHRHHESIMRAKEIIDSGELGKILWMRGRYGKSVNHEFCKTWRANKEMAGGGIFLDQGIHMLDLFLMMVSDFDEVKSYVSNLFWDLDIEDNVFAIFKNKKGQVASLHSTMTQWRHLFAFEIFLEKGHIVVNGLLTSSGAYGQEQLSVHHNLSNGPDISWNKEEIRVYNINTSWENELKIFFDCIKSDSDIPVGNSNDACKLMKLVDMVYQNGN